MAKILLIGSLTRDIIQLQDIKRYSVGGSVYYASETFQKLGDEVRLVPILSKSNKSLLRELHKEIKVSPIYVNNNFFFENIYSSENVFNRKQKILRRIEDEPGIRMQEVAGMYIEQQDFIFIGPQSASDVPLNVIKNLYRRNRKICLHAQGFFRDFSSSEVGKREWKEARQYLKQIYAMVINENNLPGLSTKVDWREALKEISQQGPQEIIISRGSAGFGVYCGGKIIELSYPKLNQAINPNGVTGTFAAAYFSERMKWKTPEEAGDLAIQAAYVKMQSWKPLKKNRKRLQEINLVRKFLSNA
jgi:hypothetical protein